MSLHSADSLLTRSMLTVEPWLNLATMSNSSVLHPAVLVSVHCFYNTHNLSKLPNLCRMHTLPLSEQNTLSRLTNK